MDSEAKRRIQKSIDMLTERMKGDFSDLEYESHLRQKRRLEEILVRAAEREAEANS